MTNRTTRNPHWLTIIIACTLNVLPCAALWRIAQSTEIVYVATYLAILSLLTIYTYWSDKRKAEKSSWRTPEKTLHILELLGGWSAAFISQRLFRHKISKTRYQTIFWLIIVIQNLFAFEYLNGWRYSHQAFDHLKNLLS